MGFLLGSVMAGSGLYYYVIEDYKVSNDLLTEDIYVRRDLLVDRLCKNIRLTRRIEPGPANGGSAPGRLCQESRGGEKDEEMRLSIAGKLGRPRPVALDTRAVQVYSVLQEESSVRGFVKVGSFARTRSGVPSTNMSNRDELVMRYETQPSSIQRSTPPPMTPGRSNPEAEGVRAMAPWSRST